MEVKRKRPDDSTLAMDIEPQLYHPDLSPSAGTQVGRIATSILGRIFNGIGIAVSQAYIRLSTRIPLAGYNGVNAQELDKRMSKINWNKDYYSADAILKGRSKARLERDIMRVNSIFRDLKRLSDSGDYKAEELRWKLQHKYWTHTKMEGQRSNTVGNIAPFDDAAVAAARLKSGDDSIGTKAQEKPVHKTKEDVQVRRDRIARKEVSRTNRISPRQKARKQSLSL